MYVVHLSNQDHNVYIACAKKEMPQSMSFVNSGLSIFNGCIQAACACATHLQLVLSTNG